MSLSTPTTQSIADSIVSDVEARISATIPLLPKSFTRVLAKALAGSLVIVYKYAGFIWLQMFVAYASFDETEVNGRKIRPLVEWGRLIGIGDPRDATRAEMTIDVSATVLSGSIAAGTQVLFPDTGAIYLTTAAVALTASTVSVTIRATDDYAGADGTLEIGNEVEFANPLPNIVRVATVTAVTVQGADAETEDEYRARVVSRFQSVPQGGAYADYRIWGESVTGIVGIYPYTGVPGEVDVYVEASVASSGSPDGIPTTAQLAAVAAAIELDDSGLASRRPVNAAVNTIAITRTGFSVNVTGLVADDLAEAKTTLETAVDEFLRSREPYILGLSVLPRKDRITQAAIAGIVDDSVSALGGSVTSVAVVGVTSYTLSDGEKAKAGTFTYL